MIITSRPRPIDGARESTYSDGNRGLRTGGGAVRSSGMSGPATRRAIRWAVSLPAMLAGALALAAPASALPPAASFTVAPAAAAPGAMVTLASTSTDPDGDALTASWDFDNDGTTDATGTTVMHAFAASATVTLRVVDAAGESASISHAVTVIAPPAAPAPDPVPPATPPPPANAPPVAGFVVDPDVAIAGRPITFSSTAVDADGTIAAERWDLNGDGRFNDASGPTVTWAFAQPGAHIVRMRVQDNAGATSTYAMTVVVDAPAERGVHDGARGRGRRRHGDVRVDVARLGWGDRQAGVVARRRRRVRRRHGRDGPAPVLDARERARPPAGHRRPRRDRHDLGARLRTRRQASAGVVHRRADRAGRRPAGRVHGARERPGRVDRRAARGTSTATADSTTPPGPRRRTPTTGRRT